MKKALGHVLIFSLLLVLLTSSPKAGAVVTAGVQANPATINPGDSTTITFTFNGGPGDTITVSEFRVFQVSSATPATYTGTLPSFTCGPTAACSGTFSVVFPSSSPAACKITGAGATCTPTSPAACATASCWSDGLTTKFDGDYLLRVTFGTSTVTNMFVVVPGCGASGLALSVICSVPEFSMSASIVVSLAFVGILFIQRGRLRRPSHIVS